MPVLLVSDTSVLIDLRRGQVLDALFRLPFEFCVPDLLHVRELHNWDGPDLRSLGLQVVSLDADGVALAQRYRQREPRLSLPDAFGLAVAKTGGHTLLAGDGNLRTLALEEGVQCHGVLWVFDRLEEQQVIDSSALAVALSTIAAHPRCRLPRAEVQRRLDRYKPKLP